MSCNSLYPEAHTLLRMATMAARGGKKTLSISSLEVVGDRFDVRMVLQDLEDEGHIVRHSSIIMVLNGCRHNQLIDKNRSNSPSEWTFKLLSDPYQSSSAEGLIDRTERSEGRRETPVGGFPTIARSNSLATSNLIDHSSEQPTFPYSYIAVSGGVTDKEGDDSAPEVVAGDRIKRRVDKRRGTGYVHRPVETWTPWEFAAHWDSETLERLWGLSPDRTNVGALTACFADLLAEGTTASDILLMIETYIARTAATGLKVDSLWKEFIAKRGQLLTQSRNPQFVAQFDRSGGGDGDPWKT